MRAEFRQDPRYLDESAALLARLGSGGEGPIDHAALVAARAEPFDADLTGVAEPVRIRADLYLPSRGGPLRVRLYRDTIEPHPLLLWLHGGGFVGGATDDIDVACAGLARRAGVGVVSLDYRLAPEHPFPAALEDTYDALSWLDAHGAALGGDGRTAAGGQSAGANLVAAACLMARDVDARGDAAPRVERQVLCYPFLDFRYDSESHRLFEGVFLTRSRSQWYDAQYLAGQPITPYAAPLRAESLAGLPPALILGAGHDPLRDDARKFAARLDEAGVPVAHLEYADTMHAFLNFPGVLSVAWDALDDIAADLRAAFAAAPVG